MTTFAPPSRARWPLLVLAALAALAALLFGAGMASASGLPAAGTRVGAMTPAVSNIVGVAERIAAGQRPSRAPSQLQIVVGHCVAAEEAGAGGRVVLFKGDPANVELGPGERVLDLPNMGSPKANWGQNSGALRQEMGRGIPIRDSAVDPSTGELINNAGFLRAERYLLHRRRWSFDPKTSFWLPPG